jgi:hypothetical protein
MHSLLSSSLYYIVSLLIVPALTMAGVRLNELANNTCDGLAGAH